MAKKQNLIIDKKNLLSYLLYHFTTCEQNVAKVISNMTVIICLWTPHSCWEKKSTLPLKILHTKFSLDEVIVVRGQCGIWVDTVHIFQTLICLSSEKMFASKEKMLLLHSAVSTQCSKLCTLPSLQKLLSLLMRLIKPVQSLFNEAPVAWSTERTIAGK